MFFVFPQRQHRKPDNIMNVGLRDINVQSLTPLLSSTKEGHRFGVVGLSFSLSRLSNFRAQP